MTRQLILLTCGPARAPPRKTHSHLPLQQQCKHARVLQACQGTRARKPELAGVFQGQVWAGKGANVVGPRLAKGGWKARPAGGEGAGLLQTCGRSTRSSSGWWRSVGELTFHRERSPMPCSRARFLTAFQRLQPGGRARAAGASDAAHSAGPTQQVT
jgi:hypothetical protein